MSLQKSGRSWVLAAAVASSMLLGSTRARAADEAAALPFMVFAAAFTVTMIVISINNPHDAEADKTDETATTEAEQAFRRAPIQAPRHSLPMIGISGHF